MNGLALCSGIGGFDLGLKRVVSGYRTVCHIEREAYAAAVLVAAMEAGRLDQAPVWDDIATFDGRPWRGVVDIVTAGLPCQPFSAAGKRGGFDDERAHGIWPHFFRILDEVRPTLAFVENVPGLLQFFRPIGEELCRLGYEFEAGVFSASEVGAPHRRERLFVLAHAIDNRTRRPATTVQSSNEPQDGIPWTDDSELAHAKNRGSGGDMGDTDLTGSQGRGLHGRERTDELPAWPPGPSDIDSWIYVLDRWPELAPSEPNLRRVADGLSYRVDRLRSLGNAVVSAQVAYAFLTLWEGIRQWDS